MQEFTVLMVVVLIAVYMASQVLKRRSLVFLTLIDGVCTSAAVLMDETLAQNELLVLAIIPATITMFGIMTLLNGWEKQWRVQDPQERMQRS